MIYLPIKPPFRELLLGMILMAAVILIAGFIIGPLTEDRAHRIALSNRITSSAVLVLCAFTWWYGGTRTTSLATMGILVALGMTAGFIGDLIMAELIPTSERVIFGIIAFGIGHILYCAAYIMLIPRLPGGAIIRLAVVFAILLAIAFAVWYFLVRNPDSASVLNAGSLGYALLMAVMVSLAVGLGLQDSRFLPLAIGAALFMTSDIILGNQIFRDNNWLLVGDVVWLTYFCGQALIVFTTSTASIRALLLAN